MQELLKKRRELYSRPEVAPAKYPFTHRIQCSECGTFYRRRIVNGSVVNESIASGEDIESREAEIKEIADTIEDLKRRIRIITENSMKDAEYADRIAEIERIITERASHQNEYDDSIVVRWWNASRYTPINTLRSSSAVGMRWKKRWNKQKSNLYRHEDRYKLLFLYTIL